MLRFLRVYLLIFVQTDGKENTRSARVLKLLSLLSFFIPEGFFHTCIYIYIYTQTPAPTLVSWVFHSISVRFYSSSVFSGVSLETLKNVRLKPPLQQGVIRTDLDFVLKMVINSFVVYRMLFMVLSKSQMLCGGWTT